MLQEGHEVRHQHGSFYDENASAPIAIAWKVHCSFISDIPFDGPIPAGVQVGYVDGEVINSNARNAERSLLELTAAGTKQRHRHGRSLALKNFVRRNRWKLFLKGHEAVKFDCLPRRNRAAVGKESRSSCFMWTLNCKAEIIATCNSTSKKQSK